MDDVARRDGAAEKGHKPAQSKLVWIVVALVLFGIVAGVTSPILITTSYRMVPRTTETVTPNGITQTRSLTREAEPVQYSLGWGALGLSAVALTVAWAAVLLWLARAWATVPKRFGPPSPALAVGLLFVPVFNLYWMFRVIPGLSAALSAALSTRFPGRSFNTGQLAGVVACVAALIPGVNLLSPVVLLVWFSLADLAVVRLRASVDDHTLPDA